MATITSYLEQLVRDTHKSEAEVLALAMQSGLRQLWREHILGQYLRGQLSRVEAIEAVGSEWVELAERQHRAAEEDVQWGLQKTSTP